MTRVSAILTVLLGTSSLAVATVEEWSGRQLGIDYTVTGNSNVAILANGTFKFQSVTSGNLDAIDSITIDDSVTGTVTVYIERDTDNDSPGATNVGSIDLTNSHATPVIGNLAALRITGDLGAVGPMVVGNVTGPMLLDDALDDITILGDLTDEIIADELGDISIGDDVPVLSDRIVANVVGNISIADDFGGQIIAGQAGNVTIDGFYTGAMRPPAAHRTA